MTAVVAAATTTSGLSGWRRNSTATEARAVAPSAMPVAAIAGCCSGTGASR